MQNMEKYQILPCFPTFAILLSVILLLFCLDTGVPRHSAGGIGLSYVCTYVVRIVYNAHAGVIEAENSVTLNYIYWYNGPLEAPQGWGG